MRLLNSQAIEIYMSLCVCYIKGVGVWNFQGRMAIYRKMGKADVW